ncbi:unnamed protein product [Chondrus crispus]|uniref:Uncharacterized protein n=1 Tax=Chondrus crispus TaxID=2769 RepID=R7QGN6_CHOCR|nr:unnamed protein product [Chondrus crispus]CDF37682.1 unnamed protein product [Chondrus crispus]|eukprot:XP_005717553.1 unnamed protein product [Chondrus crispus]
MPPVFSCMNVALSSPVQQFEHHASLLAKKGIQPRRHSYCLQCRELRKYINTLRGSHHSISCFLHYTSLTSPTNFNFPPLSSSFNSPNLNNELHRFRCSHASPRPGHPGTHDFLLFGSPSVCHSPGSSRCRRNHGR